MILVVASRGMVRGTGIPLIKQINIFVGYENVGVSRRVAEVRELYREIDGVARRWGGKICRPVTDMTSVGNGKWAVDEREDCV